MVKKHVSPLLFLSVFLVAGSLQAKNTGHNQGPGESLAPAKCGVLNPCNDGERIFMYSCSGSDVLIRLCGEKSSYKIEDQNQCVGPEKKLSKENFINFVKAQAYNVQLADKLGPISKADIEAAKSTGNLTEERSCAEQLERDIANVKNKLEQLGDVISPTAKQGLQTQISNLEISLGTRKSNITACENKEAAIKKINDQIQDSMTEICTKGMHVPKAGSFLNTVLSQYDPSKHPCSSGKDCGQDVKLKDGKVVGSLVNRTVSDSGVVEEYVQDNASKLVWGPIAPQNLNFEDAKKYCENLNSKSPPPNGMNTWHLPSKEEFRVAFNPNNSDNDKFYYNKPLKEALPDVKDRFFWSSSVYSVGGAWGFGGVNAEADFGVRDSLNSVRCVAR